MCKSLLKTIISNEAVLPSDAFFFFFFFSAFLGCVVLTEGKEVLYLAVKFTFIDRKQNVIHLSRLFVLGIFPGTWGGGPGISCVQWDPLWAYCGISAGKKKKKRLP